MDPVTWLASRLGLEDLVSGVSLHVLFLLATFLALRLAGRCQPSRQAFAWMCLPLGLLLLGFAWPVLGGVLAWSTPLFCLALLADRFVLFALLGGEPRIGRSHAGIGSLRHPYPVELHLANPSGRAMRVGVDDAYPVGMAAEGLPAEVTLAPYGAQRVTYHLLPSRRGPFAFGRIFHRVLSPLGLVWVMGRTGRDDRMTVTPDLAGIQALRVRYAKALATGALQKRKLGAEGTRFESLRSYVPGDDIRKMDWQATARLETPVIRTFSHEVEQPVLLVLDAGRKMLSLSQEAENAPDALSGHSILRPAPLIKFDHTLDAALAFAGVALDRGDQVAALVYHQTGLARLPFGAGRRHFKTLLETLSDIQPEAVEPDYERMLLSAGRMLNKRALVVIFTDLSDPIASKSLAQSVQRFSKHHLVLIITLSDNRLVSLARQSAATLDEAYVQAVSQDLLDVRQGLLAQLKRHGNIHVIDAPAGALSERLIDAYVDIKLKARL